MGPEGETVAAKIPGRDDNCLLKTKDSIFKYSPFKYCLETRDHRLISVSPDFGEFSGGDRVFGHFCRYSPHRSSPLKAKKSGRS